MFAPAPALAALGLVALCLLVYLPGLTSIPPVDRDEARFAQASRQMIETGDLVLPRFQSSARLQKPIGIYWLQVAAAALTGAANGPPWATLLAFRLPSLIGAICAVLLTYVLGRRLFGATTSFLGAALLAVSALLVVAAHLATTDAVLLACVVVAQGCLAAAYSALRRGGRASRAAAVGFWVALAIGFLVKGPVIALVSGVTMLSLLVADARVTHRPLAAGVADWAASLRPAWGVPLCLAIALPWPLVAGHDFLRESIGRDVLPKLVAGQESHGLPPGSYLLLAAATFWPGSLVAVRGLRQAFARRGRTAERFCLAWLVPTWVLLELVPTKLPHYVLPLYPALALLAARGTLDRDADTGKDPASDWKGRVAWTATRGVWLVVTGLAAIAAAGAPFALGGTPGAKLAGPATALIVIVVAALATRSTQCVRQARAPWLAVVCALLLFPPVFGWVLPAADDLWPSRAAALAVDAQASGAEVRPVAAVGYAEPSLVFLLGTRLELDDPAGAGAFLDANPRGLVLVEETLRDPLIAAARERGLELVPLWSAHSLQYSKGRGQTLVLLERAP
ncbi:MAG TPA: glycosyltransferase family 39 protein [Candidatus Bathyarchaeia archaeon]|nr:glycosyltransferase family 39 protein [Candidatus Bathyarchaeia archaeon]